MRLLERSAALVRRLGGIAVLKLDIEGGEVRAPDGMRETLARSADRLVVLAECNPGALAAADTSPEALIGALREHGLEVSLCDEETRQLLPWDEAVLDREAIVNLYAAAPR